MTRVDCPDGRPRFILKHPERAFLIAFPDWDVRIKALVKLYTGDQAKVDPHVLKQTKPIVKRLTENYATLQANYQMAYLAWCGNPCSPEAEENFNKERAKILRKESTLKKLEIATVTFKKNIPKKPKLRKKAAAKRHRVSGEKTVYEPEEEALAVPDKTLDLIQKLVSDLEL